MNITSEQIVAILKDKIADYDSKIDTAETGQVVRLGDGIASIYGLDRAVYGELLRFEDGSTGMVMSLEHDLAGAILFGSASSLHEGASVRRTGRLAQIPTGPGLTGRVVDSLGQPLDGKAPIETIEQRSVEEPAPGVLARQPVTVPLHTGILAIDAMVPIGRGQRELIIGDRQTGKTSIAIDTIINQKGKDIICIYVAIGQKISSVAQIHAMLSRYDAMDYSIIVASPASDSASMQYLAPYSATAMAEYFMNQGKDVLVVYDDLSKHAVAYRTLSLLMGRSPGREAYPGDVFYLHSRLLERACRRDKAFGGGSITALPIVETQAGDVSAYIPTNVISITDGQIYLESGLFHSGIRPAINVGLSVSRVGGSAQTKAMRSVAGSLRIGLARFNELEVFTQFSSDLDDVTKEALDYGKRLVEVLKQPLHAPRPESSDVALLYAATSRLLMDVPVENISSFVTTLLQELEKQNGDTLKAIETSGILSDENKEAIKITATRCKEREAPIWRK